ncbi:MAG: hypothetical protein IT423_20585 [Pirellulaceae bacterium]|nr:hypothetical protein [Pirellulaceae bacterium]
MASDRNSTLTIVTRSENKGIRVVVGALILFVWLRWWWTGSLFAAAANAMPPSVNEGQFGSVTGTLLPIVIDLLGFAGSIAITGLSIGWGILWDLISGVLETIGVYSKRRSAANSASNAAVEAATSSAAASAGYDLATSQSPVRGRRPVDLDKVANAILAHDDRLVAADQGFQAVNRRLRLLEEPSPTASEVARLNDRLDGMRSMFDEASKSFDQITERLYALEQSAIKKPSTRKATRQVPAKRSTKAKA